MLDISLMLIMLLSTIIQFLAAISLFTKECVLKHDTPLAI